MNIFKSVLVLLLAFTITSCDESTGGPIGANPKPTLPTGINQNKDSLEELLISSKKPAVIKFYAEWCSSCKEYAADYEAVKQEMGSQVDFYEIDIDKKKDKDLVKQLRVSRIPETFLISKNRKNISRQLGALSKAELKSLINNKLLVNKQ